MRLFAKYVCRYKKCAYICTPKLEMCKMKETQIGSFIELVENAIKEYWDLDALTDYEGATLQYKDVARKIEKLHIIFNEAGIEKGD